MTVRFAAALVVALAGALCACDGDPAGPDPAPSRTTSAPTTTTGAGDCDYATSDREKAGGPLQRDSNVFTLGMTYRKPGSLQDASFIELANQGRSTVVLDSVDLVNDPKASHLSFAGAWVGKPGAPLRTVKARGENPGAPVKGYCLAPLEAGDQVPVLILRIGPSTTADGKNVSRNNNVNVHYRTKNGQRYVAAFPVQFEYPNQPG